MCITALREDNSETDSLSPIGRQPFVTRDIVQVCIRETLNKVSLSTGIYSKLPPDEIDKQTTKDPGDVERF
jgi:hypothetical protein